MQKKIYYLSLLLGFLLLSSCKSYKDLIYMKDVGTGQDFLRAVPQEVPEYHIRTSDNLYVSILSQNPEMNQLYNPALAQNSGNQTGTQQMYGELSSQFLNGYQVDLGGYITLPVLGKIRVDGLTPAEAEIRIKARASEYLKEPTVKVKLLNYKITVLGEVTKPGVYYNYDKSINVLDAISMANGNTDYAEINNVLVLRHIQTGTETYRLNLTSSRALLTSNAYYLQPDDIVYVEPAKYKNIKLKTPTILLVLSSITTVVLILSFIYK